MVKRPVKNMRTFVLFLISYGVVFVLPMLLFFYTYQKSMDSMQENTRNISYSALENCRTTLEGQLDKLESVTARLSYDERVQDCRRVENPYVDPSTPWQLRELQQTVNALQLDTASYADVFLYFCRSDVVISSAGTHLSLDNFYGDFFRLENYSARAFRKLMEEYHYQEYLPASDLFGSDERPADGEEARPEDGILLVTSFPSMSEPEGQIVFSLSSNQIVRSMSSILEQWGSSVYIFDRKGDLLFSTEELDYESYMANWGSLTGGEAFENVSLFGEDSLVVRSVSADRRWTYVMSMPMAAVYADLEDFRSLLRLYAWLVLAVGLAAILYLSWRNSSWIAGISKITSRWLEEEPRASRDVPEEKGNEFQNVQNSIRNLYQNRCEMRQSLERQKPLMRTTFVGQLLAGRPPEEEELSWYLEQLGFQKLEGKLLVLQARFDLSDQKRDGGWMDRINWMKRLCEKQFAAELKTDVYYYDDSFELRTMILGTGALGEGEAAELLNSTAARFRREIGEEFQVSVRFAGGGFVDSLREISSSYQKACACMNTGFLTREREILWPSDLEECKPTYVYSVQTEMQIIHEVTRGGGYGLPIQPLKRGVPGKFPGPAYLCRSGGLPVF